MLDADMEVTHYGRPPLASGYNPSTDPQSLWLCCSDDGVAVAGKCSSLTSRVNGYVFANPFSNRLTCNTSLIAGHQVLEQPNSALAGGRILYRDDVAPAGALNGAVSHTVAFYIRRDNPDVANQEPMGVQCTAGAPVGGSLSWSNPTAVVTTGLRYTRTGASGGGSTSYTHAFTRPAAAWGLEAWTYHADTGEAEFYRNGALGASLSGAIRNPDQLDRVLFGNQNGTAQGLVYYGLWFCTLRVLSADQHAGLYAWVLANLW